MEYLITIAGFLVSIFTILAYIKSTFKGSVDLIVQPTFKSINDTLKNVDRTMTKLNTIVDSVVEKQHQFDKSIVILQSDVKKLNLVSDGLANKQHTLDTDLALLHQSFVNIHSRQSELEDIVRQINISSK